MKNNAMSKARIGILDKDRQAVAEILRTVLADEFALYVKTRNFHWNVTGPNFSELHGLFEKQYEELNVFVDDVAERVRALGYPAPGSMAEFLGKVTIKEIAGQTLPADKMIAGLLEDHESIIRSLRQALQACIDRHHDAGTSDFLTGLMEKHEKTAWMLRSYL